MGINGWIYVNPWGDDCQEGVWRARAAGIQPVTYPISAVKRHGSVCVVLMAFHNPDHGQKDQHTHPEGQKDIDIGLFS